MKQAVILAAGEGVRLRPFTVNRPRAMISIAGRPTLDYVIRSLADNGIRDIILVVGYHKEKIYDHAGDGHQFGVDIKYVVQAKQLGTAHALAQARESADEEFLVVPGNKLIESGTIGQLLKAGSPAILIKRVDNPSQYGVVSMQGDKLLKIVEKPSHPESDYINAGIYLFRKNVFEYLEMELDIPDVINKMISGGERIKTVVTEKRWLDVIYPWDILSFNSLILQNIQPQQSGIIESGVSLKGIVSVGENTIVHPNSYIAGPVCIGKGCEIGPNVCIFPATSIGDNVTISPFTEVSNSIIGNDVQIGTGSVIQDTVIDTGSTLGPHFTTFSEEAEVKIEKEHHLVKIGALLGSGCRIGSNVTARAGTILGNHTQIKSYKLVYGNIPDGSLII
jgi:UDP-N-acetylglucosamine diphosphorylase / glucose-1-phosphate thymidylyltransferase / UDP-N-acetylgalactosamine diphosphorylase / glucosamine-1-phosphate N-acetyltransferase / galactosamine-1-phosphate N-acetyltransferase